MTAGKYGTGQDPYCHPGSSILKNRLGLLDDALLSEAEREMSSVAANEIDFLPPPYDLGYLQRIHQRLFADHYDWVGELRSIDIAKGSPRFCNIHRMDADHSTENNRNHYYH